MANKLELAGLFLAAGALISCGQTIKTEKPTSGSSPTPSVPPNVIGEVSCKGGPYSEELIAILKKGDDPMGFAATAKDGQQIIVTIKAGNNGAYDFSPNVDSKVTVLPGEKIIEAQGVIFDLHNFALSKGGTQIDADINCQN